MIKIMNILMLSCKKATELIEKKMYFKLTKVESVQLILHKSMCDACTAYEKQSKFLDKVLKKNDNAFPFNITLSVNEELKQKIINRIK